MVSSNQSIYIVLIFILLVRLILVLWLTIYNEINRVTFHSLGYGEIASRLTVSPNQQPSLKQNGGIVQFRLKNASVKKSRTENNGLIKLRVLQRVKISKVGRDFVNFYTVEVYLVDKVIATIDKTYQEFKFFQNNLYNYLRGNQIDFPTLEQGLKFQGIKPSSGEAYR